MRTLRNAILFTVPVAGMILVLSGVLFAISLQTQLVLVVVGLLLVEGGVWRLAGKILPNERTYLALREEGERFISLMRQLNAAAVSLRESETDGARLAMDETKAEMHRSVERMVVVAGVPVDELPPDAPIELPETAPGGGTPESDGSGGPRTPAGEPAPGT